MHGPLADHDDDFEVVQVRTKKKKYQFRITEGPHAGLVRDMETPADEKLKFGIGRGKKFTRARGPLVEGFCLQNDLDISVKHAEIIISPRNEILLMDRGSSNGTYLNGKKLLANVSYPMTLSDQLVFGRKTKMRVSVLSGNHNDDAPSVDNSAAGENGDEKCPICAAALSAMTPHVGLVVIASDVY